MGVAFEKELAFLCGLGEEVYNVKGYLVIHLDVGLRIHAVVTPEKNAEGEGASAAEVPTVNGQNLSYWLKNLLNSVSKLLP